MPEFKIPMNRAVTELYVLLLAAGVIAVAWCFRAGLTVAAVCLVVGIVPVALVYWLALLLNPGRTRLLVEDEGLVIKGPPFIHAAVPFADMLHVFEADLADPQFRPGKCERGMRIAGYLNGIFRFPGGLTGLVLASGFRVVGVQTPDQLYLLGPDRTDQLFETLCAKTAR